MGDTNRHVWIMILFVHILFHFFPRNVDLREYLTEEAQVTEKNTTYDLVANVVHDGKPSEGAYRIHVLHHVRGQLSFIKPQCFSMILRVWIG